MTQLVPLEPLAQENPLPLLIPEHLPATYHNERLGGRVVIRPFRPEHLDRMEGRSFEARDLEFFENVRRNMTAIPDCFTGFEDGKVVAVAGICPLWLGVAEAFIITAPLVTQFTKAFHRAILRGLLHFCRQRQVRRLQIVIHIDNAVSQKWVERLGFNPEGLMKAYSPDGSDCIRYARVWRKKQ